MKTLINSRFLTLDRHSLDRLTLVWAMLRALLFIWTGVHFVESLVLHAQTPSRQRPQIPVVMGNNIVGRVVAADAPDEAMTGVQVRIVEADITTNLDKNGYFTATNIMNGKYSVQVLAEGSGEILATQSITLRGNDVRIPPITLERGEYVLCGRVTYADNRLLGVANARVKLGNGATVTTDTHGYYSFDNLRYNASYSLKVEMEHSSINTNVGASTHAGNAYIVYGAERTIKVSGAITRQNFIVERSSNESVMASSLKDTASDVEIGALRVNVRANVGGKLGRK
jgi:hypothetical protein